jgi:hypothetical protein
MLKRKWNFKGGIKPESYKRKPTFSRTVKESKSAALWNTCLQINK